MIRVVSGGESTGALVLVRQEYEVRGERFGRLASSGIRCLTDLSRILASREKMNE